MLLASDEPIGGIGRACGLGNPSQVSNAFRSRYGTSPRSFRSSRGIAA